MVFRVSEDQSIQNFQIIGGQTFIIENLKSVDELRFWLGLLITQTQSPTENLLLSTETIFFFFIAQTHGLPDQKRVKVHRKLSQIFEKVLHEIIFQEYFSDFENLF